MIFDLISFFCCFFVTILFSLFWENVNFYIWKKQSNRNAWRSISLHVISTSFTCDCIQMNVWKKMNRNFVQRNTWMPFAAANHIEIGVSVCYDFIADSREYLTIHEQCHRSMIAFFHHPFSVVRILLCRCVCASVFSYGWFAVCHSIKRRTHSIRPGLFSALTSRAYLANYKPCNMFIWSLQLSRGNRAKPILWTTVLNAR